MTKNSLTSLLALPLLALPAFLVAQPVYTSPVGAVSMSYPAGGNLASLPFQKAIAYQGLVGSVSGATVNLSGVPAIDSPSYIQVLSGSAVGSIRTIESSSSSSVVLSTAISGLANGDSVAIRPHNTLADVTAAFSPGDNDTIALRNTDGSSVAYTFYDGFGWYDELNDLIVDSVAVYPGEGFSINLASATEAVYIGSVSVAPVGLPFGIGSTYVGTLNPVSGTTLGSIGSTLADNDTISFYQNVGSVLNIGDSFTYYDGFGFYDEINDEIVDDTVVSTGSSAVVFSGISGQIIFPAAYTQP